MRSGQFTILSCGMAGLQAVEAETRHAFSRHSHEQYGIGLIHRGAQTSLSGRGMVEAAAGDVITVNPGEVHDGLPIRGEARAWRMLYFEPELVCDLAMDMSEGGQAFYELSRPVIRNTDVAQSFRQLFALVTATGGIASELARDEWLFSLFARADHEHSARDRPNSSCPAIGKARDLIDDLPEAAVTLRDLARESGLSRFQVLRGFVRETGFTPHAYLMQRRTDLARRLIARGTSLAEAAAASGFADQSHMTRTFVRKYGVSPGAYAAAMR